jgi:phosphate transport system permease protein
VASQARASPAPARLLGSRRRAGLGDLTLRGVSLAATLATLALIGAIVYKVVDQASLSLGHFGLGFVTSEEWNAVTDKYGALDFIFATALTSLLALLIATPIAVAIGLFLADLAPRSLRAPVGAMVETLAGVPSVVIGLWGILVLGPILRNHVDPALNAVLGWTPFFAKPSFGYTGASLFSATIVLVIMTVPIVSSVARELFTRVPRELQDGSLALGATRWETIRKVVIPYVGTGLVAASVLGLGRAVGEAIAVTQVIGVTTHGINANLFNTGDTLASRIAGQYQGAVSKLQISSLGYLALLLLVLSLLFNLGALLVIRRVERRRR